MLPGMSGEKLLSMIREIPIIVVSAKTDADSKVNLLLGGAVDYLTKPFDTKELLARINIRLRESMRTTQFPIYNYGELNIDETSRKVSLEDKTVNLTRTEFAILKLLIQNSGQVIAKSVLLDRISLGTPDCTENSLKTQIRHYEITRVKDKHRATSTRAGGVGERYTCVVDGKEIFLFYEEWYFCIYRILPGCKKGTGNRRKSSNILCNSTIPQSKLRSP